jgi:biotin carboxyl carrier protein
MENEQEQKEDKQEYQKFSIGEDTYKTLLTKKWLTRKPYEEYDPGKITSFIPGTILKVFVKEGQIVKNGEDLLILEAMKMNNIIKAPMFGKITKLHVAQGDKVANKQLLVEIKGEAIKEKKKEKKKKKEKRKK